MGLFAVLKSKYTADISDHKRKLKDLTGEEKKLQKTRLDATKEHNEGLDNQIAQYGKVAAGMAVVAGAALAAKAAFGAFAKDAQLRGAAAGVSIAALRDASKGLATDLELLTFAAATQNTQFKLNQKEMETVQKFMLVLRKSGNDYNEVQKEITKTLVEGSTEGLKKFGIVMKENSDKAEGHREIMERMRQEVEKFSGSLGIAGDGAKRSAVNISNAFRDIKVAAGELANALAPVLGLLAGIARAGSTLVTSEIDFGPEETNTRKQLAEIQNFKKSGLFFGKAKAQTLAFEKKLLAVIAQKDRSIKEFNVFRKRIGGAGFGRALLGDIGGAGSESLQREREGRQAESDRRRGRGGRGGTTFAVTDPQESRTGSLGSLGRGFRTNFAEGGIRLTPDQLAAASGAEAQKVGGGDLAFALEQINATTARLGREDQTSFLEKTFGPVDQFNLYATAFGGLTSAVGTAFDAWITGSKSIGAAFRDALAEMARSTANQMLMEAGKHGAYALGRLAFGDKPGAAKHAKTAVAFLGGAAFAGTLAKAGGAGGGARAGGGSIGAGTSGGGIGSGRGGRDVTINYFAREFDEPPEQLSSRMRRRLALSAGDDDPIVEDR